MEKISKSGEWSGVVAGSRLGVFLTPTFSALWYQSRRQLRALGRAVFPGAFEAAAALAFVTAEAVLSACAFPCGLCFNSAAHLRSHMSYAACAALVSSSVWSVARFN